MKMLMAAAATTTVMTAGLMVAPAADAAYPGSVTTHCGARQPNKWGAHDTPKLYIVVTPGQPKGTVAITFTDKKTGAKHSKTITYSGNYQTFTMSGAGLQVKHKYRAVLSYKPTSGSVYKPCAPITLLTVTY